ncbi:NDP-sugar epimerase, includes UDP-GlcNAc-inverting 4,6-dehydratase FlaA1 and capsular polysaccharide biosynthesis protein EpsC [Maridesulfovibrio ferrireducens]|uniref:NDP-sugar epimerase, includes UDP-GlcNAc-inverting 4,6-dehydratase FlaA1 and capsular polysaccharide biosynthesis protein EpsC n=1 Tax=Maridesulfovibrio ferrireducens TaxID=246191 RepID=A0A1G9CR19_9BACT|nr:nucleoside-diphosphate sugar epimerase/dehydratase [Maridesulfovibrio ferrireducens]SDK54151.1 NDP-sugar epimerase, includes UDP-GlcNAc-inverting 4,6-dehydratase FlaA1 and capsular polysaccharide biosynthesis protein EpsC [Maridesulfovibrio ferrireducens]
MINNLRNANFYMMVILDLCIFALAFYAAYLFRFDFMLPKYATIQFLELLKYAVIIKFSVFLGLGLYRGMWRYTGLRDLWHILEATFLQSLILVTLVLYKFGFDGFSRGVFIIDWMLTIFMAGGVRVLIRAFYSYHEGNSLQFAPASCPADGHNALIIGAGRAGEKVAREIMGSGQLRFKPIGFIDNDRSKRGRTIHGIPVLGGLEDLPVIIENRCVNNILIAIAEASGSQMRSIIDACKTTGLPYKILPGMDEIINGKVGIKALRDVSYQDLLGRSQVQLDTTRISQYISGKTVLVTGCGGSIGSELVRQVVRFNPAKLILIDASEANLYSIQMELHHELKFHDYVTVLGSVQNSSLLDRTFGEHKPHTVFHAAAYKHVPMVERNPWQAVNNNICGTKKVMTAADKHGVDRFVIVSTDKAVRPTNIMGASKRVTELLMRLFHNSKTTFMAVRFGNVVGSSGSVVPLFRRQIEKGGPVTVTHPNVTRYFMSISEAAQLILQAGVMAKGGEIFILEMGMPVKIADMARDLIKLSGKKPDKDIEIIFTGLREGEKLYEELITEGEDIVSTEHEKIMVLKAEENDIEAYAAELNNLLDKMAEAANNFDGEKVRVILHETVAEFDEEG